MMNAVEGVVLVSVNNALSYRGNSWMNDIRSVEVSFGLVNLSNS